MSLVGEATARYHKLIESEPYIDLTWAQALQERLKAEKLTGRPVSPVLRPRFVASRDFSSLGKASLALLTAIHRAEQAIIANPALLARLQLLPAERMLAAVEPGYSSLNMPGMLDANLQNGVLHFSGYRLSSPSTVLFSDMLADIYYDAPPVKEFRKKHKLTKLPGMKSLVQSVLKAYKEFGGKSKKPSIAVVESRAPFQPPDSSEYALFVEHLRREGITAELVLPEQLEYRNGVLKRGDWVIDVVYRAVRLQEFLVRFDLNHPLVRAYRDRAICMVNSFRAEMSTKRILFDLLTDDSFTAKFPAAERKAIQEFIPWTRYVQAAKVTHKKHTVDLPEFVMKHRAKLVLRPNDDASDLSTFRGSELDDAGWERALRQAMRAPYVVQEVTEPGRGVFPLMQYGSLVMKEMQVETHPHLFGGKLHGASTWLHVSGSGGFTTLSGLAPTFLLEGK
jgi:hypothetical protein